MDILYTRVSTIEQKTDRQRVNENEYALVIEDRVSGAVPFFEREGGKEILKLINNNIVTSLSVWQIDRLGRDLKNILETIEFMNSRNIPISFINQGLKTLDDDGKENPISKMIISILGIVGEMERTQIKERQMEGIRIAKLKKNVYLGRKPGSSESIIQFLSKEKNKKAFELLKKGYRVGEVAKITDLHINTVTKINKLVKADFNN